MRTRLTIASVLLLFLMQGRLCAGDLSAGMFNSVRGFGISLDYAAGSDILNSYMLYADTFGVYHGKYRDAGVKLVYLHYNRLTSFGSDSCEFDVVLGPGASTGYARDRDSDRFGYLLTADIALAIRAKYGRNIDLELGTFTELGFITGESGGNFQLRMYDNGLYQSLLPFLKIMIRF